MTTTMRTFATRKHGNESVVHDPLTGLTHHAGLTLDSGRVRLPGTDVASWTEIHPAAVQTDVPISVCWSPLVRCNLTCPYCLDDKSILELGRAERYRIANLLAESTVLGVDISGGEPLLLRDLPELVDVLVAGGCAVSVTTNGTHLARRAEALATRVDAVRVSLDGPDAEHHDRWRGAGSFDHAIAGIRAAITQGIPTQIQAVLLRSTALAGIRAMVDLAATLGVSGVTFLQMLPIGEGTALAGTEQLTDDEALALLAELSTTAAVPVRLRTREAAGGFTVIRADGQIWRNQPSAHAISSLRALSTASDLALTTRDGSA
ncbi:radical SAM protein [Amycolatopsis umgeniensis]|uniref:MoaA/NifB/PqqE/SkfB family radical SAM enzyme n=1 Tax=Amycolatopsis umgeniensis TaxID=336628 RepID=A0A841BC17_9PSEU|nr:radical SAM protein [Amycolatopsis umgeniensis]MBB5856375.1 MoaA/NifB/PqqE/SkfB family radical SAM enzyme [Amycolatopsis umgeniensis]